MKSSHRNIRYDTERALLISKKHFLEKKPVYISSFVPLKYFFVYLTMVRFIIMMSYFYH